MSDEERLVTVQGCKFVDEVRRRCARRASRSAWPRRAPRAQVVPECPYVMNDEYLSMIFDKYKIDYVVHGDDPCIVDGKVRPQHTRAPAALSRNRWAAQNVYQNAIDLGKYRTIPRTEGVSTTDIVGRMLLFSRDHHDKVRALSRAPPPLCKALTAALWRRSRRRLQGRRASRRQRWCRKARG